MSNAAAFLVARSSSLLFYFIGMKYFVFDARQNARRQTLRFSVLALINFVAMEGMLKALEFKSDLTLICGILLGQGVLFILNATIQRYYIFAR